MDSGASEWVFNPYAAQYFDLQDTMASINNIHFQAANGTTIRNYGQRHLKAFTDHWGKVMVDINVADVKSNLASGMRITQADNRIVLDSDGSFIENKRTGHKIEIRHENGCFVFDLWVPAKGKTSVKNTPKHAQPNNGNKRSVPGNVNKYTPLSTDDGPDDMDMSAVFVRQEDF